MNKALLIRRVQFSILLMALLTQLSFSQQSVGKEALGIDYFQQGNYEKALPIFAKLAQSYSDNAMYNYYYGVSLIKNNLFETAAKEALLNSVVDKTPANANFYLGTYFHALGQWDEAKDFYDRYAKLGSKAEKKSLRFDYYVELCEKKNNPFQPKKTSDPALFGDSLLKPPPKIDENNFPIPEALKKSWFNFQVNEILAYHSIDDFKSEASKILFTKAWICTGKNDSLLALTDSLRKEHDKIARVDTRLGMVAQIVDCEQKSYQIMRDREKFLEQSRVKESAFWEREGLKAATDYSKAIQERELALSESKKKAETPQAPSTEIEIKPDTTNAVAIKIDTESKQEPPVNQQDNIVYKVQIGSFKNGVMPPAFKQSYSKISKLRKIDQFKDEKKVVFFTVGSFSNPQDASKMKEQLVREGMKTATVATFDKATGKPAKIVPTATITKMPETAIPANTNVKLSENADKSIEKDLVIFKVQIGSFKNDQQPTVFRRAKLSISKLMEVDKYTDAKHNVIYTVGLTTVYQDAVTLKNQMVAEGLKDAFVAAFLHGERIKVNEALKIVGGK